MRRADEEDDEKDDEKPSRRSRNPRRVAKALFKSRTVLIFGEVDMKMAERVTAQLLAYARKRRRHPRHRQFAGRPCGVAATPSTT